MAYHKKNLLEAFQASAAAEKAKASEGATKDAPKAGGPFARQAAVPAPERPSTEPTASTPSGHLGSTRTATGASPRGAWRPDGLQRLIALQVLITVAAFFLGRASVSRVDAGELGPQPQQTANDQPGTSEQRSSTPVTSGSGAAVAGAFVAGEEDARPGTPAERALFDPRNRYTVKLVEYKKGRDDPLALATLQWLQDQDLPAVAQFRGSRLFLLLGAAETQKELDGLLATAKTMNGPPPLNKPAEFHDAYVVGIDRLGIR